MKSQKSFIRVLVAAGVIATSFIEISPVMALNTTQPTSRQVSITATDQYKIDYAAYKVAIEAWNVARSQQIADFLATRNAYTALLLSNQAARLEIAKEKIATITAANNSYAAAIVKNPTAAIRKGLLNARNVAISVATAKAKRELAALPLLGARSLWPVATPRPTKPVKPVTP